MERRWSLALQHVHEIKVRIEEHGAAIDQAPAAMDEDSHQLTSQLEPIWIDPATSARLKKRNVRTLIEEVLVDGARSQGIPLASRAGCPRPSINPLRLCCSSR